MAWRSWTLTTSVLDREVAELVGRAVRDPAPDPAAREEQREALDVVVAAVALRHRRAAELAAPDDERLVEQAALLQVQDQCRRRLVHLARLHGDVALDPAVVVPVAVVELHETHAALDEAPRQQAVGGEAAVERRDSVRRAHVRGLARQVVSSGTLVCMRNAISYCARRAATSGSSTHCGCDSVSARTGVERVQGPPVEARVTNGQTRAPERRRAPLPVLEGELLLQVAGRSLERERAQPRLAGAELERHDRAEGEAVGPQFRFVVPALDERGAGIVASGSGSSRLVTNLP